MAAGHAEGVFGVLEGGEAVLGLEDESGDAEPTPRPPGSALPPPTPLLNRLVNRLYFRYHRLQGNIAAYRFNRQRKAQLKKLHQTNAPPGRKAA